MAARVVPNFSRARRICGPVPGAGALWRGRICVKLPLHKHSGTFGHVFKKAGKPLNFFNHSAALKRARHFIQRRRHVNESVPAP